MRIALIGDLQYESAAEENLIYKMRQIASLKPDFSIVMGDFGGEKIGSAASLEETKTLADLLECPWHLIFGNHDVEYEPGCFDGYDTNGMFRQVFGREPYLAFTAKDVLILCITVERQPEEMLRTVNAVYVSDRQFEWVENELTAHPGMPTVIISHAPVAGNGLRCYRPMHTAALDTYLDHTYREERWIKLLKKYPQIKAWCSAHYHLGHDYATAITERDGVVHVSCGAMTACSRDGSRQTRILDITDDKRLIVSTFDHNTEEALRRDAEIDLTGNVPPWGNVAPVTCGEMLLGNDKPVRIWHSQGTGRYYISTENGVLWEYLCELNEFSGAIALHQKVDALSIEGERLIVGCEGDFFSVDMNSRGRFRCYGGLLPQEINAEESLRGEALPCVDFTTRTEQEGLYVKFIN